MPVSWLKNGGVWLGPPRGQRGGGKGNRRAQRARENLRKRLARQQAKEAGRTGEASAEAGTRTEATSTEQKQKGTYLRWRLRGKQKQIGVTSIAKQAQAKGDAKKQTLGFAGVGSEGGGPASAGAEGGEEGGGVRAQYRG